MGFDSCNTLKGLEIKANGDIIDFKNPCIIFSLTNTGDVFCYY